MEGWVEAGIEGGIHAMCLLWPHQSQEEVWGFLLIYAWNTFKEENQTDMLWQSIMSGPVTCSLHLTVTVTGTP